MPIEWDRAKPVIYSLYVVQKRSLLDVKRLLYKNYGFSASIRSYRGKLKEWEFLRRQDLLVDRETESQAQYHLQPALVQISSTNHTISNMAVQPSPLISSPNFASPWLPAMSDYGMSPSQTDQQPLNFNGFSPNSHNLADESISHHSNSTPMSLATPTQALQPLEDIDERGRTSLHRTILKRSLHDTERELATGLNPNALDAEGQSPLHLASEKGWVDFVRLLLKRGANSDLQNKSGQSPLHLAVKFPKTVKVLLASHPEVSMLDHNRNSPLHIAIPIASLDIPPKGTTIEQLIHAGADINIQNNEGKSSFELILTPTASQGKYHSQYVVLFLDNGANISVSLSIGKLPFEYFVENTLGRLKSYNSRLDSKSRNLDFKMFIAKGASCDTTIISGKSILDVFKNELQSGHDHELVQILCKSVPIASSDPDAECSLHYILEGSCGYLSGISTECPEILLQRGVAINQRSKTGDTPLTTLLKSSIYDSYTTRELADFLLKNGASPMLPDSNNDLPIFIAARIKNHSHRGEVVKLLLDAISSEKEIVECWGDTIKVTRLSSFEWWTDCLRFLNNTAWSYPTELKNQSTLPPEEAGYIVNTVLSYGALKYLELSKTSFEHLKQTKSLNHAETQGQCSQIIRILRDCDKHNIEIDSSWYRYLLNLFH